MGRYRLAIHWFRKDLRLTDNTALNAAVAGAAAVLPVYVLSTWHGEHRWTGSPRQEFLCGSLRSLAGNIEAAGGRLIVLQHRDASVALEKLLAETGADAIYFNRECDPYPKAMEKKVRAMASGRGVAVHDFKDAVLHEAGEVLTGTGQPYRVFTPYGKNWNAQPKPACGGRVTKWPWPETIRIESLPLPTLDAWGLPTCAATIVEPGERAARQRMRKFVDDLLLRYGDDRNIPAGQTTSRLSQDLRFGLIGIRELHHRVTEVMAGAERPAGQKSAQTYLNELAWREFYMAILSHWPEVFEHEFDPQWRGLPWSCDEKAFERWKNAETGFPIVDAGMRELQQTGFMHNRVRMIVAMFLTKDLHLDWRLGESYFMQTLVDGENASNNGGWQWSAGTGADAAPYFRIQNPWSQTKRYDPNGTYIKTWLPELKDVPIHRLTDAPAPLDPPLARGYPRPMVDHAEERDRCLAIFAAHREKTGQRG